MARVIGQAMSAILKQPVIVENKAGANGAIASEFVMRAPPDGYTLMLGYVATHAMNPALQKLRYDPVKDFEPVGMLGSSATLMVLNPAVKASNAKEVVAMLKAAPDKANYASAGNGTAPHFAAEMFKLSTGTSMLHVPYKGSAPAITDTIGGQTQVMFPSLYTAMPYVKAGKLKAVGVAGPKRSALMPDVPTLQEQGIADVDVSQWYGIFAPAKTPKADRRATQQGAQRRAGRQGGRQAPRRPRRRGVDDDDRPDAQLRGTGAGQVEEGGPGRQDHRRLR